jgi:2-polyprenyl-3-methyl-5-hydroxy-6-metoxy-1,4-benzoquinol methylase
VPFLTQQRFPRLWLFAQHVVGCNGAKKELALRHYRGERRVLEIGCSAGNIASAFAKADYTGIDIDEGALALARRRFGGRPNFRFQQISLADLAASGAEFDYVLFAGILHHVPDDVATEMLVEALSLVAEGGTLVISEPEAVRPGDGIVLRLFYKLEQGRFLRSREALEALVRRAGVNISRADDQLMRMSPGMPHVARFNLLAQLPA